MLSKSKLALFVAAAVAGLGAATNAYSDTITYSGVASGSEVTGWENSAIQKTMDLTSSNIYGSSLGGINWTYVANYTTGNYTWALGTGAGYQYNGNGSTNHGNSYKLSGTAAKIDNWASTSLEYAGADVASSLSATGITFTFTLTAATGYNFSGKVVRVGVMQNLFSTGDTGKTLTLTGPGNSTSGTVDVTSTSGAPNMYFFDITGVTSGDTFSLTANGAAITSGNYLAPQGYIGPMSFDIASVPEPTTLSLFAVGAIGLLAARRKTRHSH